MCQQPWRAEAPAEWLDLADAWTSCQPRTELAADDVERAHEHGTLIVATPGRGELDPGGVVDERAVNRALHGHLAHGGRDERDAEPSRDEAHEGRGLPHLVRGHGLEAVGGAGVLDGVVEDGAEMRG